MRHRGAVAAGPDVLEALDPQAGVRAHAAACVPRDLDRVEERRRLRADGADDRPRRHVLAVREVDVERRRARDPGLEQQLDAELARVPRRVLDELRVALPAPLALRALRAVQLRQQRRPRMDDQDAALVAADAGVLALRQQPDEVGQLARDLGAGVAAAGDHEREQPATLGRVTLDVRELEHLEHVVLQRQAVAEGLQLERVLGEARVGVEALACCRGRARGGRSRARSARRRDACW